MNSLTETRERLTAATDLPAALEVAYDAFEDLLAVLRRHQEDEQAAFAALVLASCAAANGRDWIAAAPTLPAAVPGERVRDLMGGAALAEVAAAAAAVAGDLATRLELAAAKAADPEDQTCCAQAAAEAAAVRNLLGGSSPP